MQNSDFDSHFNIEYITSAKDSQYIIKEIDIEHIRKKLKRHLKYSPETVSTNMMLKTSQITFPILSSNIKNLLLVLEVGIPFSIFLQNLAKIGFIGWIPSLISKKDFGIRL